LSGAYGNDSLLGGDGDDILNGLLGDDNLSGGRGDDTLVGGQGIDTLTGGAGKDIFKFTKRDDLPIAEDSLYGGPDHNDTITDFEAGDKIDLSAIDADFAEGDQAFVFIGDEPSATRDDLLRYSPETGTLYMGINIAGPIGTYHEISFTGKPELSASDFIL